METQWGGLRNPEIRNQVRLGLISPSAGITRDSGEHKYKKRYLSSLESLVYYFGEDWFDLNGDKKQAVQKGRDKHKRQFTQTQPKRCGECGEPWGKDADGFYYIDNDNFNRLPMLNQTCPECL